jgi:glutamate racemase
MPQAMRPIGIFDSGIGGLTVARAISQRFPNHPLIYFGDTAHLPYGEKSPELIRHYAKRITKELVKMDCAVIVVACNSASSNALDEVKTAAGHSVPVIDVIHPVVESVSRQFQGDAGGVIGTRATIDSGWYQRLLEERGCLVKAKVTPLLASAIEEGFHEGKVSSALIEAYLTDDFLEGIKALVLGCTHYPLISEQILRVLPQGVEIVDSAEAVADVLNRLDLVVISGSPDIDAVERPHRRFIVSDFTQSFQRGAERFFGAHVTLEERKLSE